VIITNYKYLYLNCFYFCLYLVPDGKPTVTDARNTSSSSIRVQWAPPPRNTIHGEFLGYRIKFRKHGVPLTGTQKEREVTLRDPDLRVRMTIHSTCKLRAFND